MPPDAIVIGGGAAGLAAATLLAEKGRRVTVLERKPRLGGRASSYRDRETGETLDNGQHLFLGCYVHTVAYLARIGAMPDLAFWDGFETPLFGRDGSRATLKLGALPAPLHTLWGILGLSSLTWRERLAVGRVALAARFGSAARLRSTSVRAWLAASGQSPAAIERFWEPLVLATLNADPTRVAADQLAVVLRRGFMASRRASRIGLARVGLTELLGDPAAAYLAGRDGAVRTRARVAGIVFADGVARAVRLEDGEVLRADSIVAAVPPPALADLCAEAPGSLRDALAPLAQLRPSPILSLHLWLDAPLAAEPLVGLWGTAFHWIFRRDKVLRDPGTRHVTLVLSGADAHMERPKPEIVALAERELSAAFGRGVRATRAVLIKEPEATWLAPIGDESGRLPPGRLAPGLFVCGDWTGTGLPGTIESAVESGHRAARAVLGR